jgi:hypothetical protein
MVNRNYIECSTCGKRTMTRVAMGHGERQEFAFPCHGCNIEIRIGMTLDQKAATWTYDFLHGATWLSPNVEPEPEHVENLDGETLIPLQLDGFSPFLATFHLPQDPILYDDERKIRFDISMRIWPLLNQLIVHRNTKNSTLFDKTARSLYYGGGLNDWSDRLRAELLIFRSNMSFFRPFTSPHEILVSQRINYVESLMGNQISVLIHELAAVYPNDNLNREIQQVRNNFIRIFPAISGVYQTLYWDKTQSNLTLDNFYLAEKRFNELKSIYIDCFETFARLAVLAATIEGTILHKTPVIPKKNGTMSVSNFQTMPNGNKPDILRSMPIGHIFIPVMDSKLRNGLGHHSTTYDIIKDEVSYSNQNNQGIQHYQISYIRFCEAIMNLYRMFEISTLYADWLRARINGLSGRVV